MLKQLLSLLTHLGQLLFPRRGLEEQEGGEEEEERHINKRTEVVMQKCQLLPKPL